MGDVGCGVGEGRDVGYEGVKELVGLRVGALEMLGLRVCGDEVGE